MMSDRVANVSGSTASFGAPVNLRGRNFGASPRGVEIRLSPEFCFWDRVDVAQFLADKIALSCSTNL